MPQYHCGEALCKKPVGPLSKGQSWPIQCKHCRVHLYPRDVMQDLPLRDLEPTRSVLQKNVDGRLVDANSDDVGSLLEDLLENAGTSGGVSASEPRSPLPLVVGVVFLGLGVAALLLYLYS